MQRVALVSISYNADLLSSLSLLYPLLIYSHLKPNLISPHLFFYPVFFLLIFSPLLSGHAYAKALHYRELEFQTSPAACFESLININKKLDQYDAAIGVLKVVGQMQKKHPELVSYQTSIHLISPMHVIITRMQTLSATSLHCNHHHITGFPLPSLTTAPNALQLSSTLPYYCPSRFE